MIDIEQTKYAKKIVKKSNALVRAHWNIESVWEPRLVNTVASKIRMDDEDFHTYTIPLKEITEPGKRLGGKDYAELVAAVERLMSRPIKIQESPTAISIYNIFAKCKIDAEKRTVTVCFHPDLKPHFLNLKERFTKISLAEFMSLPSTYSQRLFEILKSWDDKSEVEISLESLYEMLDIPASYRANFLNFRRRILEQAHKDVVEREGSSLWFDWEPIKSGRAGKVVAIRFVFNWKKAQDMEKNQPTDEVFITAKLQQGSNRCFERVVIRARKKCTPKPKTPRCQFCLKRGRMAAQQIVEENQGKLNI